MLLLRECAYIWMGSEARRKYQFTIDHLIPKDAGELMILKI